MFGKTDQGAAADPFAIVLTLDHCMHICHCILRYTAPRFRCLAFIIIRGLALEEQTGQHNLSCAYRAAVGGWRMIFGRSDTSLPLLRNQIGPYGGPVDCPLHQGR